MTMRIFHNFGACCTLFRPNQLSVSTNESAIVFLSLDRIISLVRNAVTNQFSMLKAQNGVISMRFNFRSDYNN